MHNELRQKLLAAQTYGLTIADDLFIVLFMCLVSGQRHALLIVKPAVLSNFRRVLQQTLTVFGLQHSEYVVSNESTGEDLGNSLIAQQSSIASSSKAIRTFVPETPSKSPIHQTNSMTNRASSLDARRQSSTHIMDTEDQQSAKQSPFGPLFTAAMNQGAILPRATPATLIDELPFIVLLDNIQWASIDFQEEVMEIMDGRPIQINNISYYLQPTIVLAIASEAGDALPALDIRLMDRFFLADHFSSDATGWVADDIFDGEPLLELQELQRFCHKASNVYISPKIDLYIRDLVVAVRFNASTLMGGTSQAYVDFVQAARAFAFTNGYKFVTPQHVAIICDRVLAHRMLLLGDAQLASIDEINRCHNLNAHGIVNDALEGITPPY